MALSVLIDRIGTLPRADRDDLFELLQAWRQADDPDERASIRRAMEEVLAQTPVDVMRLPLGDRKPVPGKLKKWSDYVGQKIRELREAQGLTQLQLADKAGLKQSHVSRLENAEHTPTYLTLEKIAGALGVPVGEIDPCTD